MATEVKKGYSREQIKARKERKALKTNDKVATASFIISLLMFLFFGFVSTYFGLALFIPTLQDPQFAANLGEALGAPGLLIYLLLTLMYSILVLNFITPFFYAVSLRRGDKKRHKKFFGALAVLSALSVSVAFVWLGASIGAVIEVALFYGIVGVINMLLMKWAHSASLFEAKRRGLRRREEGKLHGGALFVYALNNSAFLLMSFLGDIVPMDITVWVYFAAVALCVLMIFVASCKRARYAGKERREDREMQKQLEIYEQSLMPVEEEEPDEYDLELAFE